LRKFQLESNSVSLSDTNRAPAYLSAVELAPVALTAKRNLQTFAGLKCLQILWKFKLIDRPGHRQWPTATRAQGARWAGQHDSHPRPPPTRRRSRLTHRPSQHYSWTPQHEN